MTTLAATASRTANGAPPAMVELFAPAPLAAVALLALNDHVLKRALHDNLTGKLSDFAICFFLPLYLSALLGLVVRGHLSARVIAGAVVTTLVYTLLEMSDVAGALFARAIAVVAPAFGFGPVSLTRDPTDLFALALVPLAVVYGLRRARRAAGASR